MSLALLLPAALSALGALALPLLLHLRRRRQRVPVDFAALRWLAAAPRPRARPRWQERWLLLLRLLLLALAALWLARPVLQPDSGAPVVAVMPGVTAASLDAAAVPADARRLWLATGFPTVDREAPATPQPVASLLRQLDARLPRGVPLTVLATRQFDGADGQMPVLSRPVRWLAKSDPAPVLPRMLPAGPPRLHVFSDAEHWAQAQYLAAAAFAWDPDAPPITRDAAAAPDHGNGVVAWFSASPLPPSLRDWIGRGGTVLLPGRSPAGPQDAGADSRRLLEAEEASRGRQLRFVRELEPRSFPALLDARFPGDLLAAVAPSLPASRADSRHWQPSIGQARVQPDAIDLRPWLAVGIGLLFLLERLLATRRRRWPA